MSAPPNADGGRGSTLHADNEDSNELVMADSDSTPQASLRDKEQRESNKDGKKRRFFGLGKRKESSEKTPTKSSITTAASPTSTTTSAAAAITRTPAVAAGGATSPPLEIPRAAPRSPPQAGQPSLSAAAAAASPARSTRYNRSASPQLHSPASSMIFERNVVQEGGAIIPDDASVHIPTHIQTEDHIPPVLEASSLAITDDHLGPDEVEIVMHAAHQPAAEKVVGSGVVSGGGGGAGSDTGAISPIQGLSPVEDFGVNLHKSLESTQAAVASQFPPPSLSSPSLPQSPQQQGQGQGGDDAASSYGAIDTADVRRLSFISFADVVQSEHVESGRDSVLHMSISNSTTAATNRSPSPVRSPVGTSPPTSGAPSMKGLDIGAATAASAAGARLPGSPTSSGVPHSPTTATAGGGGGGGDIVVETMRQALRKTGSGEVIPKSALESHAAGDESVFR